MFLVISAPSGAGKGTVIKKLTENTNYVLSISMTTRPPRGAETDGREYFFRETDEFKQAITDGELLEYAEFNGFLYGTPKKHIDEYINAGKTVILEINVEGALQIKKKYCDSALVFVIPPDKSELETRLKKRGTQSEASIRERMQIAEQEIKNIYAYDYVVVNDTVEDAVKQIETIVAAEQLKPRRNKAKIESYKTK